MAMPGQEALLHIPLGSAIETFNLVARLATHERIAKVTSVNECKFGCGLRWPLVSSPVG
jgi:hypothetical protein